MDNLANDGDVLVNKCFGTASCISFKVIVGGMKGVLALSRGEVNQNMFQPIDSAYLASYSGPFRKNMVVGKEKNESRQNQGVNRLSFTTPEAVRHYKSDQISLARNHDRYAKWI